MFGIDDMIGGLAGLGGSLINADANNTAAGNAKNDLQKALALINSQQGYGYVTPTSYNGYTMPDQVNGQQVADSPEARQMMVSKLKEISDLADKGMNPKMQEQYLNARNMAGTANRGNQEALKAEFARRGQAGGGNELMMREMGNQNANDTMASEMAKQAADNANMQYQAGLASFTGAGQLRGQDVGLNKTNSDIINQFNQLNAKNKMDTQNANTYLQNSQIANENNYNRTLSQQNTNLANQKLQQNAGLYSGNYSIPQIGMAQAGANQNTTNNAMTSLGQIGEGLGSSIFGKKPKYDDQTGEEL